MHTYSSPLETMLGFLFVTVSTNVSREFATMTGYYDSWHYFTKLFTDEFECQQMCSNMGCIIDSFDDVTRLCTLSTDEFEYKGLLNPSKFESSHYSAMFIPILGSLLIELIFKHVKIYDELLALAAWSLGV